MTDSPEPNYDYFYEDDIYKIVYKVSTRFNIYLQIFTIFVNIFHLIVLTRKDLRSSAIYIIMIGICIFDIIFFILDFYNNAIELMWINNWFPNSEDTCLRPDYTEVNPYTQSIYTIRDITKRISVWLAIAMALIRTLSVMFPMANSIQRMAKPKSAVFTILGVFGFWAVYSCWHFVTFRIFWLPDNLSKYCKFLPLTKARERYVLAVPASLPYLMNDLGWMEGVINIVPAICYPILTILLILELRTIKKKRQNMKKNENEKSNTTKLILFMTVTFMLSEGLAGVYALLMYNIEWLLKKHEDFANALIAAGYPILNLKTINAASHAFVCYLMSSQYRDVVKAMFSESVLCKKKMKIRKVEETRSTSFASVGKSTTFG